MNTFTFFRPPNESVARPFFPSPISHARSEHVYYIYRSKEIHVYEDESIQIKKKNKTKKREREKAETYTSALVGGGAYAPNGDYSNRPPLAAPRRAV